MFLVFNSEKEIIICSKNKSVALAKINKLALSGILINLESISGGPFRFRYVLKKIKGQYLVNLEPYTRQVIDALMLEALDRYNGNSSDYLFILKDFIRSIIC